MSQSPEVKEETVYLCSSEGCGKQANMACPTCIKIGLPPTRFCSQECFKNNWASHKALHKVVKLARQEAKGDPTLIPREFQGYYFTGPLRPAGKTPRRTVPKHIPRPDYADHPEGLPISEINDKRSNTSIRVYTPEEIEGIREACRIGREVLDAGAAVVKAGVTCEEIDRVVHEATVERNAYPSPLNYHQFPKSLCTSVNEVVCHGIPDKRELVDGDIVNLDISVYYNGFHADLNETFFVGKVDSEGRKLVETAYNCLSAAINMARPGTLYRDFGMAINKVAAQNKCSVVTTYCGHGIGTLFHTAPDVPHYARNKAKGVLQVGHVFTIEPMINLGKHRDCLWPDGWTVVTEDGSRSAQFEHTMVVTETGVELLTARIGCPTDRMEWDPEYFQK